MGDALAGARAIAAIKAHPSPAKHNAPLDEIERSAHQLLVALTQLRRHSRSHRNFWRFSGFGPVRADKVENVNFRPILTTSHRAAHDARVCRIGRPPKLRKQQIVGLALAFSARYSPDRPSSDENNFFRSAERFFEFATGLSPEKKGHDIGRQIRVVLQRLPIEMERRAALLNETRSR